MKFKKEVLKTGEYFAPEGKVVVTTDRMQHWKDKHKEMLAAGLRLPIPWGHLSKAKPLTYEEKEFLESKFNAGFIDDYEIVKGPDGIETFNAIIDIPLQEDADKVGNIVKEVSPQIESAFVDGKGRVWNDVITHLALVTLPVAPGQSNFQPIHDDPVPTGGIRLSLSMRNTKMAEKEEKNETSHTTCVDKELLKLLEDTIGVVLGDDTNDDNFVERLKPALLTLKEQMDKFEQQATTQPPGGEGDQFQDLENELNKGQTDMTNTDNATKTPPETPNLPKEEQQPTMTMSLKDKAEFENTKVRLSLAEKKLEESERLRMESDIQHLLESGRITPVIANQLKEGTKVYKLSLRSDNTEEPNLVKAQIETFKLMPEGAAWDANEKVTLRNRGQEADLPTSFGDISDEDAEKLANNQLKVAGHGFTSN